MHSVLNVNVLVSAFNQEKVLVGAFSVIVKTNRSFAALFYSLLGEAGKVKINISIPSPHTLLPQHSTLGVSAGSHEYRNTSIKLIQITFTFTYQTEE